MKTLPAIIHIVTLGTMINNATCADPAGTGTIRGSRSSPREVRAIVGEAAGEGRVGMLAVAGAIRNRGTLKGVYGTKNPIVDKQPAWVFERARIAWAISATNDITRGATHWESKDFKTPYWSKSMTVTTNIGKHVFYK